jgi:MFS family permease
MMMPNSLAILGNSFSGAARGRAIGIWAAFGAATGAFGPLLGGWLIDTVGWRAIFFINLPLATGAIILALRYIADDRKNDRAKLDLPGAALAAIMLLALTWGLTVASEAKALDRNAVFLFGLGALAAILFIWAERRRGDAAMLPLALFASSGFTGLMVVTFLLYGALGGLLVVIPYVLIEADAYSATAAGAALLPLPLVMAVASPQMGKIAGRIGSRLPLTIGPMIVAVGFLATARIGDAGSYWTTTLPAMLLISIGMTGAVAPLTTAVLSSVSSKHTGIASGLNSAVARTGGLIATAFTSGLLASHGVELLANFHIAAWVAAAASVAAGISAFIWVGRS